MSDNTLNSRGHALEGKFFNDMEASQLEKFKAERAANLAVSELASLTGFRNEEVLRKLVDLGVEASSMAALNLVPMVYVAWIDRTLDTLERRTIMDEVTNAGLQDWSPAYQLLESWLDKPIPQDLFPAWAEFYTAIVAELDESAAADLRADVLGGAERVARATGGFLGLGSISSDEKGALEQIRAVVG